MLRIPVLQRWRRRQTEAEAEVDGFTQLPYVKSSKPVSGWLLLGITPKVVSVSTFMTRVSEMDP